MKHRKTMMLLGMIIAITLMASSMLVNAAKTLQYNPAPTVTPTTYSAEELENLEPEEIEKLLREYESLPEAESLPSRNLWTLWARGRSWTLIDEPTTDAASAENYAIGMRLTIRPVKITSLGTLFKVVRGAVSNREESHRVQGVGFVTRQGTLIMLLEGEDTELVTLGRVQQWGYFKLVAMKGRMRMDGEGYGFSMKGIAFRLSLWSNAKDPFPVDEAEIN
jgi:hypothetical protein